MMKLYLASINHPPHLLDAQESVNVSAIFSVLRWKIRTWWGRSSQFGTGGRWQNWQASRRRYRIVQMHYQPVNE